MDPFVSILLPVYNGEQYLTEALDSVLSQSYTHFELLIINDASTDNTQDILDAYAGKDNRITLYNNGSNFGVAKSLNILLKQAKGSYIARIDADDIWLPGKLEKQIIYLESHPGIYLLGTAKQTIDEQGKLLKGKEKSIFSPEDIKKNILKGNLFCHSSVVFRREILDTIGYYNENYKNTEDYEYWLRVISTFKVEIFPEVLTCYRLHRKMIFYKKRNQQLFYLIKAKYRFRNLINHRFSFIFYILKELYVIFIPRSILRF